MSTYLASYLDSIPLGASILDMQNTLVGNLTANGWQLLAQVNGDHSDLIPPATETIGTSKFREVVRIYFPNNTTITIGSYQVCIADAYPQSIRLTAKTAGAVQAGVTINGVTVLGAMGSAGSSANDNLQALYYALMDSTDPTITAWSFFYDGNGTLICTAKTPAAMVACSGNANVNYFAHAQSVLAGARSGFANIDATYGYSVTVDLTNGFVYYMDVFSRTFTLSTKCLSGVTGPIFASYADHTEALAVTPAGPCTPMELWVGRSDAASGLATARSTHWFGIGTRYFQWAVPAVETTTTVNPLSYGDSHPFTGAIGTNQVSDVCNGYCNGATLGSGDPVNFGELTAVNSTPGTFSTTLASYRIAPVMASALAWPNTVTYSYTYRFMEAVNLPDIRKWHGTEPNETSVICYVQPALASYPTLAQALDATTAYSSILLSSTAGLPSQGTVIIGSEEITYTGTSGGNTLTGTTMGANGSPRARHFVGHTVYPGTWFLKVNNGAVCCGPTKPV